VVSELTWTPSTKNATRDTPTLSLAVAASVTVPRSVWPLVGWVSATDGGSSSFSTVAVRSVLAELFAASKATARRVWGPLAKDRVDQL
jgi:hypothetical protein